MDTICDQLPQLTKKQTNDNRQSNQSINQSIAHQQQPVLKIMYIVLYSVQCTSALMYSKLDFIQEYGF